MTTGYKLRFQTVRVNTHGKALRRCSGRMKAETYFKRNGCIYGISEKFAFGKWTGYAVKFTDYEKAVNWLHTHEYDFRTRYLTSKTQAKQYRLIDVD